MIDIEDEIFDRVAKKLRSVEKDVRIYGEDMVTPSAFPCVTLIEADNTTDKNTQDSSCNENHANLMYEVNVYSNLLSGKKKQCKTLLEVIDNEFISLGFARTTKLYLPVQDSTVCRLTARYSAKVSREKIIFRR